MFDLRAHTLALQRLEQSAVENVGLRMRLLDERALTGKGGRDYARAFVEALVGDMKDETEGAARLGVELGAAIDKAVEKAKA